MSIDEVEPKFRIGRFAFGKKLGQEITQFPAEEAVEERKVPWIVDFFNVGKKVQEQRESDASIYDYPTARKSKVTHRAHVVVLDASSSHYFPEHEVTVMPVGPDQVRVGKCLKGQENKCFEGSWERMLIEEEINEYHGSNRFFKWLPNSIKH